MYADGSVKRTVGYGFKTALIGTQFMYTAKFKVGLEKAEFIDAYLVGRLPENLVARSGASDKRGNYTVHYVFTTTNHAERHILWEALKYAEAWDLRRQADIAEKKARGEWYPMQEQEEKPVRVEFMDDDDLPF